MNDLYKSSDEELINLLPDSNILAFEELYNRYWEKAYVCSLKKTCSKEASEEIVQDFFTSLWLNRYKLRQISTFNAYLYSSIRYRVFNFYNKKYVRNNYLASLQFINSDFDNSTEETIALNDLKENVEKQVNQLPLKCRSVYQLSRKENKTNKEIAEAMGISEKTVENHLTKALKRLRLSLNQVLFFL